MAAATIQKTSYGYRVTGDTGITEISTYPMYLKAIGFYSGTADNAVVVSSLVSGGLAEVFKVPATVAKSLNMVNFQDGDNHGAKFDSLSLTLSAGGDICYLFVR